MSRLDELMDLCRGRADYMGVRAMELHNTKSASLELFYKNKTSTYSGDSLDQCAEMAIEDFRPYVKPVQTNVLKLLTGQRDGDND